MPAHSTRPKLLPNETGLRRLGLTGTSLTDAGWFLAPLYWEQYLKGGNAALVFGRGS